MSAISTFLGAQNLHERGVSTYEGRAPDDMAHNLSCMLHIVIVQQVSFFFSLSLSFSAREKQT